MSVLRPLHRTAALALLVVVSASDARAQRTPTDRYDNTFRKYSKHYFGPSFDWRLFKAQAIVESNLRITARSWAGARGIMQLMPTTFKEIRSKNPEINGRWDVPEWNIAAGIAYSRQLWKAWTNDSVVEHVREFTLSSYNAGRLTLIRAQKAAEDRALDPRAWPSIETVAPTIPRWRYDETLSYLSRIFTTLEDMDPHGRITRDP